jgi:hypothetical protein
MLFFVSRQHYWGVDEEDAYIVEIAMGGTDYANPDMLTPKWRHLGEGKEYTDPKEAVEAAIRVCDAWRASGETNAKVAMGSTGGNTLPFEPKEYEEARKRAQELYDKLPKCDQCGDLIDSDDETYTNEMDETFCSEVCADKNYYACQESSDG